MDWEGVAQVETLLPERSPERAVRYQSAIDLANYHTLQELDAELMPWGMRRFEQGAVTYVRRLEDLPPQAAMEKEVLAFKRKC